MQSYIIGINKRACNILGNENRCHNYFQCFKGTVVAKIFAGELLFLPLSLFLSRLPVGIYSINLVSLHSCILCKTPPPLISQCHRLFHFRLCPFRPFLPFCLSNLLNDCLSHFNRKSKQIFQSMSLIF